MDKFTIQKKFAPILKQMPKDVVNALRHVLSATAMVETIRPVSEAIKDRALAKYKPNVEDTECGRIVERVGQPITKWDDLYLATDDDARKIYDFHKAELAKEGFTAKGDLCPFLVAESHLREAKRKLFKVMEPYTGIGDEQLLLLEMRRKYFELIMGMLITLADEQGIELNTLK